MGLSLRTATVILASMISMNLLCAESGILLNLGHGDSVNTVAISPDGKVALSGSADRAIKVWDTGSGRLIRNLAYRSAISALRKAI